MRHREQAERPDHLLTRFQKGASTMPATDSLIPLLGEPRNTAPDALENLQREWGVTFPAEYVAFANGYGDASVSEFIFVFGPRTLASYAESMGPLLEDTPDVPGTVLPKPGGMLLWGNTAEGDQLCLVDRGDGRWTVSAFRRGWGDWYDSELTVVDWFRGVLTEEVAADWFPEWDETHTVEVMAD
jgi:hypothetical protein